MVGRRSTARSCLANARIGRTGLAFEGRTAVLGYGSMLRRKEGTRPEDPVGDKTQPSVDDLAVSVIMQLIFRFASD